MFSDIVPRGVGGFTSAAAVVSLAYQGTGGFRVENGNCEVSCLVVLWSLIAIGLFFLPG